MCWYFGQIEPWQILRNKQTIRDSWLGLVIVPSVYHCQGPQKTLFLLWVWGLKAKHCHWITAPPCSAWRKSFLYVDYAGPGLAWHWGGTCTSQCTRADVAQHALPWQTPHSHAHPGAHDEELSTPEVLVFHIHSGHIDIDQYRYIHQSLAPLRTINKRAESQKATVLLVSRFQASSSKLIGKPSI